MQCPYCGFTERRLPNGKREGHSVKETRKRDDGGISRRRECGGCSQYFMTIEQLSSQQLRVAKANGEVVLFDQETLRDSFQLAAVAKLEYEELADLVKTVENHVYRLAADGAIPSAKIGEAALQALKESGHSVSQVRYALVFYGALDRVDARTGWKDVGDVLHWLATEYPDLERRAQAPRRREVVKRDYRRVPFDRSTLEAGIAKAAEGRGTPERPVWRLAADVANEVERELGNQPIVTSGQIAGEVLRSLRHHEPIAYLRFAGMAKAYEQPDDYYNEAAALRQLR